MADQLWAERPRNHALRPLLTPLQDLFDSLNLLDGTPAEQFCA